MGFNGEGYHFVRTGRDGYRNPGLDLGCPQGIFGRENVLVPGSGQLEMDFYQTEAFDGIDFVVFQYKGYFVF
jgi:hypothetical protein